MRAPATLPVGGARWAPIVKAAVSGGMAPNLRDYEGTCAEFSWNEARNWLDGLPGGRGLNIAHEAVDRHAVGRDGSRIALRWLGRDGAGQDFTYDGLRRVTSRFANVLGRLGISKGDVVATLAGRIPGLYIAALGTLKNGSVYTPLYSAFGPDPIVSRMTIARARVLVTTDLLYRRKVEPVRGQMPALEHVLLIRETAASLPPATHDFNALLDAASDAFTIPATDPQDLALLHLHERYHWQAEGRHARPRGGRRALRHRTLRARLSPRRPVLVHGRSGVGDRHVVRHHRAAGARPDDDRGRSGLRRRAVVSNHPRPAGHHLVHRAHGNPHADEGWHTAGAPPRLAKPALSRQRRRAAQIPRGWCGASKLSVNRSTSPCIAVRSGRSRTRPRSSSRR